MWLGRLDSIYTDLFFTLFILQMNFQIVNTEWGAFSNGLPLTEFDREMDSQSINPGEQVLFSLRLNQ